MGGICPDSNKQQHRQNKTTRQNQPKPTAEPPQSQRPLTTIPKANLRDLTTEYPTTIRKKSQAEAVQNQSGPSTPRTDKMEGKTSSSEITKSVKSFQSQLSSSSNNVFNIQSSSIIRKNAIKFTPEMAKDIENCYVFIDQLFFIRKSSDNLKVVSPYRVTRLNCPMNSVVSTCYVQEGIPFSSLKEVKQMVVIQSSESPIETTLILVCKHCQKKNKGEEVRQVKMTFATSLIQANQITCDECGRKDQWRLVKMTSNFPVWGNGQKISQNRKLQKLPSIMRVLGCINCYNYPSQYHKLRCGCIVCPNCYDELQYMECKICKQL